MSDYRDVLEMWAWRVIPNCPGRYQLPPTSDPPATIVGEPVFTESYAITHARDPVLVVRLEEGGLISYEKPDGTYVHTLADADGFARKLTQLGLDPHP